MGYLLHQIVVAEYDSASPEDYRPLEQWRETLAPEWKTLVVGPIIAPVNCCVWWVLLPDGSKEGWADSDKGDEIRQQFIEIANGRKRWPSVQLHASFGDGGPMILGGWPDA